MEILDMQLLQERVSWSVVEMFAMAAVISKLQSLLEASGSNGSNGNGNGNGNSTTKMTEKDLIAQCVGTGLSTKDLDKNFELVYNPVSDSIQVVNNYSIQGGLYGTTWLDDVKREGVENYYPRLEL